MGFINSQKFGLLASVAPSMRITPATARPRRTTSTTCWRGMEEAGLLLAQPKAIAAFERECTVRGVPPVTVRYVRHADGRLAGRAASALRQAGNEEPLSIQSMARHDQHFAAADRRGRSRSRRAESDTGIPGEIQPGLSARLMGLDSLGVASYLLSLYSSSAALTDDALGVLENVEVGYYTITLAARPAALKTG